MDKHTPGPWEVATGPGISGGIKHAAGYIAFTGLPRKVSDEKAPGESWLDMRERTQAERIAVEQEEKANASLIAAAPELLATVIAQHRVIDQMLAWMIENRPIFYPTKSAFWPLIQEANANHVIAKARGEKA